MPVLIFPPIGICMLCCQPESFCSLRHHFHSSVIKTILMQTNKISNKQKSKFLKKIQNIYLIHDHAMLKEKLKVTVKTLYPETLWYYEKLQLIRKFKILRFNLPY